MPDAKNGNKKRYGMARMLEVLNQNLEKPVKELLSAVEKDVHAFVGDVDPFDDITMLALRFQ